MLYIGYLIIVNGQNIQKIGLGNCDFCAAEGEKLHKQVVPQSLESPPPPPAPTPNRSKLRIFLGRCKQRIKKSNLGEFF